jgi:hypothetical protein
MHACAAGRGLVAIAAGVIRRPHLDKFTNFKVKNTT